MTDVTRCDETKRTEAATNAVQCRGSFPLKHKPTLMIFGPLWLLANRTATWIEERGESATGCSAEEIVKTMSNGMGVASLFSLFMGGAQHQPATGHLPPNGSNAALAHGVLGRPSLALRGGQPNPVNKTIQLYGNA